MIVSLSHVAEINPRADVPSHLNQDTMLDFLPMADVSETGVALPTAQRPLKEVQKGFTAFRKGDILVAKITPCFENNKIAVADIETEFGFGSTEFHVVRCDRSRLDSRYVLHLLRSNDFRAEGKKRMTGSAGQQRVPKSFLEDLQIPLPPLAEQKRIATILDQADELRRKRQRALDRLNQLGQAIFVEMFGDPVANPMGWKTARLGDIVRANDKINYGVVQPGDEVESGVPVVRVGDLLTGYIDISKVKQISSEIEAKYSRSRLIGDEILIGCVGSIGTVALAHKGLAGANIARAVARIPIDTAIASREFVAEQIRSPFVQRYFTAETRTVAQPTLNIGLIAETPIIVPPIAEQIRYETRMKQISEVSKRFVSHYQHLVSVFASLQSRAFKEGL